MELKKINEKNYLSESGNIHLSYYVAAADKLGIDYEIIVKGLMAKFSANNKIWYIINTVTPLNNIPSGTIAKRKYLTNLILSKNNIPVPTQAKILNQNEALEFFRQYNHIVLKPSQAIGGHGVSILPQNEDEVIAAFESAKSHSKSKGDIKVLAEEFIAGENYRVLVLDNKIIGVVRRLPARVIGNGTNTIEELINLEDENRKARLLGPIPVDAEVIKKLTHENKSLVTIPQAGEVVYLRYNANLTTGGTTQECASEVSDYYKDLCINAVKACSMKFAGVDLITPDITKPAKCAINELNYNPGLRPHYKPDSGEVVDVASEIMKYISENE
jgi:D-alanine-D-alanine ligase-like ATP-grasp enzyme